MNLKELEVEELEAMAQLRVDENPELKPHEAMIFYDWPNWEEHLEWIISAPISEIVDWAESIEDAVMADAEIEQE